MSKLPVYGKISRELARKLKPMARALLLTIACCINRKRNELRISLKALAEEAGMHHQTVLTWTAELERLGYLQVTRSKGGSHNDVNVYKLCGDAAVVGLWNQALETSESSAEGDASKISRAGLEQLDGFINESNDISDDDEFNDSSDTGEFSFQNEGRDDEQNHHDASRKYLEERGVRAATLDSASKHPIAQIEKAFALAATHAESNRAGYALAVLKNGDFKSPSWAQRGYRSPSPPASLRAQGGRGLGGGVSVVNRPAVKTDFHKSSWAEFADNPKEVT